VATFSGWEAALLRALGAPVTKANIAWLDAWQKTEGGAARFNPLNTTQPAAGATSYNSAGVRNYTSAAQGTAATAATLKNGRYSQIVAALRSGNPQVFYNRTASGDAQLISQIDTWGSHGFAAEVSGGEVSDPGPNASNSGASQAASIAAGGIFGGLESWLSGVGKTVLAYMLLVGVAGGLFLTGLKGLGVKPPKVPAVVPA
jgi:hypothetical protein